MHGIWIVQFFNFYSLHRLLEGGRIYGIENSNKLVISIYEDLSVNGDRGDGKTFNVQFEQKIYEAYSLYINFDTAAKTAKVELDNGPTTLIDLNAQVIMDSNNYGLKSKLSFPKTSGKVSFIN